MSKESEPYSTISLNAGERRESSLHFVLALQANSKPKIMVMGYRQILLACLRGQKAVSKAIKIHFAKEGQTVFKNVNSPKGTIFFFDSTHKDHI